MCSSASCPFLQIYIKEALRWGQSPLLACSSGCLSGEPLQPPPPGCRSEGLRRLLHRLQRCFPAMRMFSAPSTFTCWTSTSRGRKPDLLLRPQEPSVLRLSLATADFPPTAATGSPAPPSAARPRTLLRPHNTLRLPLGGVHAAPTTIPSRALQSVVLHAKTLFLGERLLGEHLLEGHSRSSCLAGRSVEWRGSSQRTSGRPRATPSWRGSGGEPSEPSGTARGRPRGSSPCRSR